MTSSERVAKDIRDQALKDLLDSRNTPIGGSGSGSAEPVGMGNLAGWAMSAAMIGAVLGGIAGQGLAGAVVGGLLSGGALWVLAKLARLSGAWNRDARVWVWLVGGAITGVFVGVFFSIKDGEPLFYAIETWSIFLGGLAALFCWIARGAARRVQ